MRPTLTHVALHVRDLEGCVSFYAAYCGLRITHRRDGVVWMAEAGREEELILVFLAGGSGRGQEAGDYGHLGFAVGSRDEVDAVAARAEAEGRLIWPPRDEPWPTGYYCGVCDPDGRAVEFSYGQPLGPGAEDGRPGP